jgi:hypothetical protein
MKKILMTLLMALIAVNAFAANPLKVKDGDKKFFRKAKGECLLEVVYTGASFDGKMPLTEKYSDIDNKTTISYEGFVEEYNDRNKNLPVVKDESKAKYKITILVTKVDEFVNIMGFIPGPCIRVWGTLTVTDLSDNSTIVVVDIDEIDGGSAPTTDRAFNDTFGELGKRIAKL